MRVCGTVGINACSRALCLRRPQNLEDALALIEYQCLLKGFVLETPIPRQPPQTFPPYQCLLKGFVLETTTPLFTLGIGWVYQCLLKGFVLETE